MKLELSEITLEENKSIIICLPRIGKDKFLILDEELPVLIEFLKYAQR